MLLSLMASLAVTAHAADDAQAAQAVPAGLPVAAFAKPAVFTDFRLSPDGQYVAVLVPNDRNSGLATIRVSDSKQVGSLQLQPNDHIADYWWASDDTLVATLAVQYSRDDLPSLTGEMVAVKVDGSDFRYLFGDRNAPGLRNSRRARQQWVYAGAAMVDPLIDDPNHILVKSRKWIDFDRNPELLLRLDLKTGDLETLATSPEPGSPTRFVIDHEGQVRYAVTERHVFNAKAWQRLPGKDKWQQVEAPGDADVEPLSFSRDGRSVYLLSREFGPRSCLVEHVLETGTRNKLACDHRAEVDHVITSFDRRGVPIAAVFSPGKPELKLLDIDHPHRELLKLLAEAFPGKQVQPASLTRDGKRALIFVYDDRTPGDYYFFDTTTRKADYFAGVRDWIDPELMSEQRPITLNARDGTPLWGYLTVPKGLSPMRMPLVMMPHGGPYEVRDEWGFDPEVQLLASRGYAVLQVNFRGSSGYGGDFVDAGRKAWATTMIDDITDAVRWSIAQGFVDPSRICISGASYGGYAALMSAVREPDLYRCVVGTAGVYDLKLLKKESDVGRKASGREYLSEAIGSSEAEQIAQSPITYLDRLLAPMLIVHGEDDARAPVSQAKALRRELQRRKLPHQWLVKAEEGHGFQKTDNVIEYYEKLLAFLDENIGKARAAPTPATP